MNNSNLPVHCCETHLPRHQGEWLISASNISVTWSVIQQQQQRRRRPQTCHRSAHLFRPIECQARWPSGPWVGECFDFINESNSPQSCLTLFQDIIMQWTLQKHNTGSDNQAYFGYFPPDLSACFVITLRFDAINLQHWLTRGNRCNKTIIAAFKTAVVIKF